MVECNFYRFRVDGSEGSDLTFKTLTLLERKRGFMIVVGIYVLFFFVQGSECSCMCTKNLRQRPQHKLPISLV